MITDISCLQAAWQGFYRRRDVAARAVGARQRLFNVVINERRQANTDGDVGGDAFIKHMRDLQVIDPLTYTFGCLPGRFFAAIGQQHHKLFSTKAGDNIA